MTIDYALDALFGTSNELDGWTRDGVRQLLQGLEHRFWIGQRVRMREEERRRFLRMKSFTATVVETRPFGSLRVLRDGLKRPDWWGESMWEPVPTGEFGVDETCNALVAAYQAGEQGAALALADRLIELHGGTAKERTC